MASIALHAPDSIKAYSRVGLQLYDTLIVNGVAPYVWGCHPQHFLDHYDRHVTSNHADVGVGTGYFLDRCAFNSLRPRIALLDLQPNCLRHAARRLARYQPETWVRDALEPIRLSGPPFDSICLGGILHCLPGDLSQKSRVFDSLRPIAAPGARLFGYTLVADDVGRRWRSRLVHRVLNRLRFISNTGDHIADLTRELTSRFEQPQVYAIGCMAFFSAAFPV